MPWTLSHADLVAAREQAAEDAREFGGNTAYQRLGRAHRWLDEDDAARASFHRAAEDLRTRVIERGRGGHASTWQNYGHLLRLAGDDQGARAAFEQALTLVREEWREVELRYMLGQDPGGGGEDGLKAPTIRVLAARDRAAIARAREEMVLTVRASQSMPDLTASELTLYDLIEETFRVEAELTGEPVPGHVEMLGRAGLLREGPAPPPPAIEPPPIGRWTVGAASIEQGDEGPIVARIDDELCIELIQSFGEYEVRTYRGDIHVNSTGMHPTFGEAVEAAADALRSESGEAAVATLMALVAEYGQPH